MKENIKKLWENISFGHKVILTLLVPLLLIAVSLESTLWGQYNDTLTSFIGISTTILLIAAFVVGYRDLKKL